MSMESYLCTKYLWYFNPIYIIKYLFLPIKKIQDVLPNFAGYWVILTKQIQLINISRISQMYASFHPSG